MSSFLTHWFWPNPAGWDYGSGSAFTLLIVCGALIVGSFLLRWWRKRLTNAMTKTLSRSWSSALFWFGLVGLVLIVCRVEHIQFLSMRILWAVWALCFVLFALFQFWQFQRRHYTVIKSSGVTQDDELRRYLPRKKQR